MQFGIPVFWCVCVPFAIKMPHLWIAFCQDVTSLGRVVYACVCVCVRVRRPFTTIANCGRESETLNFMLTLKCVSGVDFVPNSPQ